MGINRLNQLLYAGGFFLVRNIGLTLGGGWKSGVRDLTRVSQKGILGHSHHLEGHQPTLLEPMGPCLMDNRLHGLLGICKTLVVPFLFAGFKSRFEVNDLINLGQVKIVRLC